MYMAVGEKSMRDCPDNLLTKEWVDAHILRIEEWLKNNS